MKLEDLHNKYSGHAWLIGNGPSLRETSLELLKDEYSFGVNMIHLYYPYTTWRPTFYVSTSTLADKYRGVANQAQIAFMPDSVPGNYVKLNIHEGDWSDDISKGISKWATVMFATMQIAIYIGFNPLYLLGCDLDYGTEKTHMVPDHPKVPRDKIEQENRNQYKAHQIAKENCDRLGIKVINCTTGGMLDMYPRMDIKNVL